MKKLNIFNFLLAVAVFCFIWVPYTRIFLVGIANGETITIFSSIVLCVVSVITYRKHKSKFSLITFSIGLSPVIFILLIGILAYFHLVPLAP